MGIVLEFGHVVRFVEWFVICICALSILNKKRDPVACLGWLLAVVTFPFLGAALYIIGGVSPYEALARRKRLSSRLARSEEGPETRAFARASAIEQLQSENFEGFEATAAWTAWAGGHAFFEDTGIEFLENSTSVYTAFEDAILRAERLIFVQFYQILPDAVGRHFYGLLAEKARAGVSVYVLYDAMGSYKISADHLRQIKAAGIKIHSFMGFHPLKRRLQINWRNHRKLLIVDGKTAFVGGFNLGEMYLEGRDPENPVWRDVHFRMVGRIAHHLEKVFREDWHFATGQSIDPLAKADGSAVFPSDSNLTPVLCLPFSSGPSDGRASFHTALLSVLYEAKRRVWISTAYFVPDKALLQALRQAVARGVDVRLVLPKRSNHPITDFCTTSYFQELTELGVVLNLYNPGMLHAKILLADEDLVLTGSSNQDYRSFFLNFELDLLIRSATATGKINEYFQSIFNKSSILNKSEIEREYRKFSLLRRIARLCSPLM